MQFRSKDPEQVSADALKMAARKEAEGCSPCAEVYRELAKDPSRRRLLGRALAGAGALTAASLLDVGGALAGSPAKPAGHGTATELPRYEADRLGALLRDHSAVEPLARFLEQRGQRLSGHEALAMTLNGHAVGTALIQRHGADAFLIVGKAADGKIVPGGAVHGTQAFVVRNSAVVVDAGTSERLAALRNPAPAIRGVIGPSVASAAGCPPNTCYALAAGCGFFSGCCFAGFPTTAACCPFGGAFCAAMFNCCFG